MVIFSMCLFVDVPDSSSDMEPRTTLGPTPFALRNNTTRSLANPAAAMQGLVFSF